MAIPVSETRLMALSEVDLVGLARRVSTELRRRNLSVTILQDSTHERRQSSVEVEGLVDGNRVTTTVTFEVPEGTG
jgi:hypothetical protein